MNTTALVRTDEVSTFDMPDLSGILVNVEQRNERHRRRADMLMELVNAMPVTNQMEADLAQSELRDVKEAIKRQDAERRGTVDPYNAFVKRVNDWYNPNIRTLEAAETSLKAKLAAFFDQQQRLANEAKRQADGAAEAERLRIEAEAEALRQKAAGAKTEATRAKLEGQAEALQQSAAIVIAHPAVQAASRASGISTRQTLDFEVTNLLQLLAHVVAKSADQPHLLTLIKTDDAKLRALVKMLGEATDLPGVRVFKKTGIAVR